MMKQLLPFPLLLLMMIPFGTALSQGSLSHAWSKNLSNTAIAGGQVEGRTITTDAAGNIYVAGNFRDRNDFDPGPGYQQLATNGNEDIYFAKYTPSGTLVFARSFGSVNTELAYAIALDAAGNIYLAGTFGGFCDFDPGPGITSINTVSGQDIFFAKYSPEGNFIFARRMGGTNVERAYDMAVDPVSGSIYVAGEFAGSVDFDPGPATATLIASGVDGFFARYDPNGNYLYARRIGGTAADQALSIKLDASGNIWVAGFFNGTASMSTSPAVSLTSVGGADGFLAKYDINGNHLFSMRMGGTSTDIANALSIDATGNVYVTGEFRNVADFGPDPANHSLTSAGNADVFVAKYSPAGVYQYARSVGGTDADRGYSLAISGTEVIVCGGFSGTADFQPGTGVTNLVSAGSNDGFVARYTDAGTLVYAHRMGSTAADEHRAVAATGTGIAYVTGFFWGSVDFDPGPGTTVLIAPSTSSSNFNSFFAGYNATGNFTTAGLLGGVAGANAGSFAELPRRIRTDAAGNVYLCGIFQGEVDFDPGPGTSLLTSNGGNDVFFAKYNSAGGLLFVKSIGTTTNEDVTDLQVDASGNIHLVGYFRGTVDFDPGAGTANLISAGLDDLFFAKYDANGNLVFARGTGAAGDDRCHGLALDATGNIYISGFFKETVDFDPGAGTTSLTASGSSDIFFAKYTASGNLQFAKNIGSTYSGSVNEVAYGITVDASENIFITGGFLGTADFDPGAGTATLTAAGTTSEDIFLAKYNSNGNYLFAVIEGNTFSDIGYRILVDGSGNIFVCGLRTSATLNSPNIYLRKFTAAGDGSAGIFVGGTGFDAAYDMALDAAGNVLITGEMTGTADFSENIQPYVINSSTNTKDAFVAKYSNSVKLEFAYSVGGGNTDIGYGIATGPGGEFYLCGIISAPVSVDLHYGTNELQPSNSSDAFFSKYTNCVPQVPVSFRDGSAIVKGASRIVSNDCGLLATVQPTSLTGIATGKVWIENSVPLSNGRPYVARHYEITPTTETTSATYTVTLYFTQAEFNAFNNHPGSVLKLPTNPDDLTGVSNVRIGRFEGSSSNGTGLPETYTGAASVIDPSLRWIAGSNLWEVIFSTTGRGGFIVQTTTDIITSLRNEPATTIPGVRIYPNPVQRNLQVQLPVAVAGRRIQLRLMDLQGRVLKTWQPAGATLLSLPVGELPSGTYLLELHDGQRQRQVTKILKQ